MEEQNKRAEQIFERHFKAQFVQMQTDSIINVRMLVAETLGLLFSRHESIDVHTPDFSSQSEDEERSRPEYKRKVYLKSLLCNDELIIGMVRRLSFDSNRDIKTPLNHIELPSLPEPSAVELSEVALESMRRRSSLDDQAEEQIDTS